MNETRADQVAKDIADNICDLADRVSGSLDRIMISAGCLQDILALRLKPLLDTAPSSEHCAVNGCVHKEHGFPTWPAGSNPFPPDPDLSSLRKGAEDLRTAIEDAIEKLNTYRGAAVQTVIDQLEAALVSGSREDGADG